MKYQSLTSLICCIHRSYYNIVTYYSQLQWLCYRTTSLQPAASNYYGKSTITAVFDFLLFVPCFINDKATHIFKADYILSPENIGNAKMTAIMVNKFTLQIVHYTIIRAAAHVLKQIVKSVQLVL